MKELHLITIGKLSDKSYQDIEHDYLKRISLFKLQIHELKSRSENLDLEAKDTLQKILEIGKGKNPYIVLLKEKGKVYDSPSFAKSLQTLLDQNRPVIFVIGGAAGHGNEILEREESSLSLSPLTFPHQMARVIFVEQLYRATTILSMHPYHK